MGFQRMEEVSSHIMAKVWENRNIQSLWIFMVEAEIHTNPKV